MSNAELWDLDTSGGIMEQIQMMVAPPISAEGQRRSRRRREREVYRRPGRAVNHDCCDSCKEGGDLLCCDRCPAAFHLLCHDPPLDEETLPPGEWLCHKCKTMPQELPPVVIVPVKDDDTESTSSKSSSKSSRGKRTLLTIGTETETEHPLTTLAKAARYMNPMQFDVGKDIACNVPLPGSSKRMYGKAAKNQPKKQAHELDNGLVPLPAKTCFSCNKSCRVAPLIQCDYCPLLFHLDCLNPPLTTLPTGRWMCPNHVEHFLDSHMLKSQSLTERLRLWDRYNNLADSHTVKLNFLNKIHRKHPMFRYKRKLPARPSVAVPPAIKQFYANPTTLLPEAPRPGPPTTNTIADLPGNRGSYVASLEEQEEWLSSVVSMQASIAKYLAQKQIQKCSASLRLSDLTPTSGKPTASVAPVMQREPDSDAALTLDAQKSSPMLSCSSSSSSSSSTNTAIESPDCDTNKQASASTAALLNGDQKSIYSNNGAYMDSRLHAGNPRAMLDTPVRGAVSLLPSNLSNMHSSSVGLNGEVDMEVDGSAQQSIDQRMRSNSGDSIPSPLTPGWSDGDINGSKSAISSLNKHQSKGFSGKTQVAKVILPNNKVPGYGSTQGQSQRSGLSPKASDIPPTSRVNNMTTPPAGLSNRINKSNAINNIIGSSPTIANLNSLLQQWIEGNAGDGELSKIDEQLTYILAWQRLQQLVPQSKTSVSLASNPSMLNSCSAASGKKGLLNVYLSQQSAPEVRSRAVLCPLSGKGQAIPMPYRTLSLGTGADMDVKLSDYGFCNFISGHHATIFYDEMSRHFELLNYSEHGTTVDNVLYSCDFSDKPATTPLLSPTVAAVRDIIKEPGTGKSRTATRCKSGEGPERERRGLTVDKPRMSARSQEISQTCSCSASGTSLIGGGEAGWEGTALLHHGSYVKVGCLQFVFSIIDHAPDVPRGKSRDSHNTSSHHNHHKHHNRDHHRYHHREHHQQPPLQQFNVDPDLGVSAGHYGPTASSSKFSNVPLLSTSHYLHNQSSTLHQQSLFKSSDLH